MMDAKRRAAILSRYTNDYIVVLCSENGLDPAKYKDKEARILALAEVLEVEPEVAVGGIGGATNVDPEMLKVLMTQMERDRERDRELMDTFRAMIERLPKDKKDYIPLKEVSKIDSDVDIVLWFKTFENVAKRRGVVDYACALEPFLTGVAQSAYFAVPEAERKDYKKVKEAIFLRYKLTPSAYRSKFRSEVKSRNETFLDYATRLETYFYYWISPSNELKANPEAADIFRKILVDQFISTIKDETLRLKLVEREDKSLFEIAKFSDNYLIERNLARSQGGLRSDTKGDSPVQSNAHSKDNPSSKSQKKPGGKYSDACYNCGELGHIKRNCPKLPKKAGSKTESKSYRVKVQGQVIDENCGPELGNPIETVYSESVVKVCINDSHNVHGLVDSGSGV